MKLYHGSYIDIDIIDLKKSMKGKDFGQGFYLTESLQQAIDMSKFRCIATNSKPVINVYDFDIVYGPIANDRIGLQIRHLLENEIDMDTFMERLKYMKGITYQYFFGTQKAIDTLSKCQSIYPKVD